MNWFERYAVVGGYFTLIMACTMYINELIIFHKDYVGLYGSIMLTLILPIGYFLSVFSQWLYYWNLNGIQVHKKIVEKFDDTYRHLFHIENTDSELEIELKITSALRLSYDSSKYEYLGKFATKRWDILALSSAVNLVNKIFWIFFAIITIRQFVLFNMPSNKKYDLVLLAITVVISSLSYASYRLSMEQIININKKMCDKYVGNLKILSAESIPIANNSRHKFFLKKVIEKIMNILMKVKKCYVHKRKKRAMSNSRRCCQPHPRHTVRKQSSP